MLWAVRFTYGDGGLVAICCVFAGTIQSPVTVWRVPTSMSSVLQKTLQSLFVKTTWHPLSHSCLIDRREEWARPGMMCAKVAVLPRLGRSRLPTCVE